MNLIYELSWDIPASHTNKTKQKKKQTAHKPFPVTDLPDRPKSVGTAEKQTSQKRKGAPFPWELGY